MIRDQFYRQIIERLEGTLDPELFEQCATDLLRVLHPTLVPIRGGSDAGMDGAIADGEGLAFPLICTTSPRVIPNLTNSLKSYLKNGGTRRKVVLTTSQKLTPKKRRNLEKRAAEFGFTLVQIYDQATLANLLYRDPKWCLELLNLTGDPAPLSVVPLSERPLITQVLIGRQADLSWLHQSTGDRLLVGQPGSGKTFLLRQLVMEGVGLFVISRDRGEIAGAIRSQQPTMLIVDDAQACLDLLANLRQIREEIGAEFSILASCWPGDQEKIAQALNLPNSQIHQLNLLTRDEIVEVIKATGIHGPNGLIHEIVNQAEGRPGLAVTLAHFCLQGGVEEVTLGDALSGSILKFFEPLVGPHASIILAAFSIGGDFGMSMNDVANALELNLLDVRDTTIKLAAGGVIFEIDPKHLSVRPAALRHALVRDTFFKGATSFPIERLLARAPSLRYAARTLIGARARGGSVPQDFLISLLEQAQSYEAWKEYAWLGQDEVSWILKHHPEKIITIARPALHHDPEIAIPMLLKAAIGDQREIRLTTEHPLRLIEDWVHAGYPGSGEALKRRQVLLNKVQEWLSSKKNLNVGLHALRITLSPEFQDHSTDPGKGHTVTLRRGYILPKEVLALKDLWEKALHVIKTVEITNWGLLRNLVEEWTYPRLLNVEESLELSNTMRSFVRQMLHDIVELANEHPGILHWANQIAKHLNIDLEIKLDLDFEVLFPEKNLKNWRAAEEQQINAVRKLADNWCILDLSQVAKRITLFEQEARLGGRNWPRWTPLLCEEIAKRVVSPRAWAQALIDNNFAADLVSPFLQKAAEINEFGWVELAHFCLEQSMLKWAVSLWILTFHNPPQALISKVLQNMDGASNLVKSYCIRRRIPEDIARQLLRHNDITIASAAAWGEWYAEPEGNIRTSLLEDWRVAVQNSVDDDYWLCEVFKGDHSLAYEWIQTQISKQHSELFRYEGVVKTAVEVLNSDDRRRILQQIPETYEFAYIVLLPLVGENLTLYRDLLNCDLLKDFHLVPLAGAPNGVWIEKAKLALDGGYSIDDVANAVYGYPVILTWSGDESAMWAEWIERFDHLCSNEDDRIRQVGVAGKANAKDAYEHALKRERNEAIYGTF